MDITDFLTDRSVRSYWIAFFTQWVLWGLVYFIRHIFGYDAAERPATSAEPEATEEGKPRKRFAMGAGSFGTRLNHAHRVLMENTLLLLSVLVLNTFAAGSTRAVMILTWIYFALTAIVAFSEVGYGHRFVRFVYSAVFYAITLAIGGLAFSHGWTG
ncbi:hypothetical protein BX666DRAFT_1938107 [Dichotomocladium elegans]|nr:hypothetical protein BX666DRAFT_1938107 [Dichotomocladium elegans]